MKLMNVFPSVIFASIAAHAAADEADRGMNEVTPYWRTLKAGGVINEKYPGGVEEQKRLLQKEGHQVDQKGRKAVLVDFEKNLVKL